MKELREFSVHLANLKQPVYQFVYEIDDAFFDAFESTLVQSGKLNVRVEMNNLAHSLDFKFQIEGHIKLTCDVSLEDFDYPIKTDNHLIIKFGQEEKDISEEIIVIPEDSGTFNLASYIYEFIGIEVPYKKVHPKYVTDDEEATLRYGTESIENTPSEDQNIDPRWAALKNIRL